MKIIAISACLAASGAVASIGYNAAIDTPHTARLSHETSGELVRPSAENRPPLGRYEGSFWAQFRADALPVLFAGFHHSN